MQAQQQSNHAALVLTMLLLMSDKVATRKFEGTNTLPSCGTMLDARSFISVALPQLFVPQMPTMLPGHTQNNGSKHQETRDEIVLSAAALLRLEARCGHASDCRHIQTCSYDAGESSFSRYPFRDEDLGR